MKRFKSKALFVCVLVLMLGIVEVSFGVPPTNNNRQNAKSIGNVTNMAFDTTEATPDGPEVCMSSKNIWYCYTAPCTGAATVSLCGSSFDTKLAIYSGCNSTPSLSNMLRCNDDFCGRQSEVVFPVTAGNKYLIEVGGYNSFEFGQGILNITCDGAAEPPANDNWSSAQPVGNVSELPFDTTYATFDGSGNCITSPNIWYCYTAQSTGNITVSLCDSEFDTMLAIYNGCNSFPTLANLIDCNDDFCHRQSQITFAATAGNKYLIEVGGYDTESRTGQGVLSISSDSISPPGELLNDDCINAISIGNVTNLAFDTTEAHFDGPGRCMTTPNIWYCYTAPGTGPVTVSLCGSQYDTKLGVYNGCGCNPLPGSLIGCNDDSCGRQSELTFDAISGNKYLIEIGGWTDSDYGPGILNIRSQGSPPPPPSGSNDNCQNAKQIGNVSGMAFSTSNATFDGPGHCMTSPNIWYVYTATCTGEAMVSLCGSGYDTKLAVYNGGACNPSLSRLIECNDDSCGWQSEVTFEAIAGQQYLIEVGGFGDNKGNGLISVNCEGTAPTSQSDLGDAPDSTNNFGRNMTAYPKGGPSGVKAHYPTVYNDGRSTGPFGPIHLNNPIVAHLGKAITSENEADTGPDQDVVNNIKPTTNTPDNDKSDDGIIFPVNMPKCRWTTLDYIVNVVTPGTNLWVNVWCDWNRDGDWDDDTTTNPTLACSGGIVSEWAVQNQYLINLPAGLNQLKTPAFLSWHPDTGISPIWMRITLSRKPWTGGSAPGVRGNGGSGPRDGHEFGETEDYYFTPNTGFSICEDYNGDGVINLQDLAAFTTDWLENCP